MRRLLNVVLRERLSITGGGLVLGSTGGTPVRGWVGLVADKFGTVDVFGEIGVEGEVDFVAGGNKTIG
jgi:hypothetical protein